MFKKIHFVQKFIQIKNGHTISDDLRTEAQAALKALVTSAAAAAAEHKGRGGDGGDGGRRRRLLQATAEEVKRTPSGLPYTDSQKELGIKESPCPVSSLNYTTFQNFCFYWGKIRVKWICFRLKRDPCP
jgi:hypothetical protein